MGFKLKIFKSVYGYIQNLWLVAKCLIFFFNSNKIYKTNNRGLNFRCLKILELKTIEIGGLLPV